MTLAGETIPPESACLVMCLTASAAPIIPVVDIPGITDGSVLLYV